MKVNRRNLREKVYLELDYSFDFRKIARISLNWPISRKETFLCGNEGERNFFGEILN